MLAHIGAVDGDTNAFIVAQHYGSAGPGWPGSPAQGSCGEGDPGEPEEFFVTQYGLYGSIGTSEGSRMFRPIGSSVPYPHSGASVHPPRAHKISTAAARQCRPIP